MHGAEVAIEDQSIEKEDERRGKEGNGRFRLSL